MDQEVKEDLGVCACCFARLGQRISEEQGRSEVLCFFKEAWMRPSQVAPCRIQTRYAPTPEHVKVARKEIRARKCAEPRPDGKERRSEPRKEQKTK